MLEAPPQGLNTLKAADIFPEQKSSLITIKVSNDAEAILNQGYTPQNALVLGREQVVMNGLVKLLNPRCVFEIGTAWGGTTYNFFLNTEEGCEIFTLDELEQPIARPEVATMFEHPRVHRLRGNSLRFDFSPWERSCDLIFIDGNHDAVTIRCDTENAFRMIRPGGIILWHDDIPLFPGVQQWLLELERHEPVSHIENTALAIWRCPL
ncbi:MAG: class I SAM-dependent methyltransferase [Deltaproteobacteria bacterium]|nr:class I SAM-dependent methyltransferase [Deltaproteobacteria bacterium]